MEMWMKLCRSFRDHIKPKRIARELGISHVEAVGHIVFLWTWILDLAPDGSLQDFSIDEIEEDGARWTGESGTFVTACVKHGIMDENDGKPTAIHDWMNYAGGYREAQKMAKVRACKSVPVQKPVQKPVQGSINSPLLSSDLLSSQDQKPEKTMDELLNWGEESETIKATLEAFASTRKTGKMAESVTRRILERMWEYREKHGFELVVDACKVYLDRDCAADGKDEKYFFGILRNEAKTPAERRRKPKAKPKPPPGCG